MTLAQFNDAVHHAIHVAFTGESFLYYQPYARDPISALGQALTWEFPPPDRTEVNRNTDSRHSVIFVQNHDQIGNRARGERLIELAGESKVEAALAIVLLSPSVPFLFMGEEWGAHEPFLYFCDYEGEMANAVREGRRQEFRFQKEEIPDPCAIETFRASVLDWGERQTERGRRHVERVRKLLSFRRDRIVPLLKHSVGAVSVAHEISDDGALTVKWNFSRATLMLRTNLTSSHALTLSDRGAGTVLYSTPRGRTDSDFKGWVEWTLL